MAHEELFTPPSHLIAPEGERGPFYLRSNGEGASYTVVTYPPELGTFGAGPFGGRENAEALAAGLNFVWKNQQRPTANVDESPVLEDYIPD